MRTTKKILFINIVLVLIFVPSFSPNRFVFSEENDPIDFLFEESNYAEITEDTEIDHYFEIPFGATLLVKKGVTLTFNGGEIGVLGKIVFKGTVKKPIILKKAPGAPNYFVSSNNGGEIEMRNVDVSGGGSNEPPPVIIGDKSIWKNANALGPRGAIDIPRGKLVAEGCDFHNNEIAVSFGFYNSETRINRSKFSQNSVYDIMASPYNFNLKYNWWGSENGPDMEKILGNADYSDWAKSKNFHDPVILIPGILGSQKKDEKWEMDPIFHTYDELEKTFEKNGYVKDRDLFVFPYEWRDSNVENALKLKDRINEIKAAVKWPKVDLVAHSMGGLMSRSYIESEYYQDDVDQLVTMGTPHRGSPKSYPTWEAGELLTPSGIIDVLADKIFKQEAKENGYSSIFEYIRKRPMDSVRELLPNYDYLFSVSDNLMRKYPNFYPVNLFLDDLNSESNLKKLEKVEFTNIYGIMDDEKSTITSIQVGEPSSVSGSVWEHGFPEDYDSFSGDHGLSKGKGDETVPLESSTGIPSDDKMEAKNIVHGNLPKEVPNYAYEAITGLIPEKRIEDIATDQVFLIIVLSPVDIQVIDEETGLKIGKNFETEEEINEIEGAYYSGFETINEFITIPNPGERKKYQILIQGTGEGEYKIEVANVFKDRVSGKIQESKAEITGLAEDGKKEEKNVALKSNETFIDEGDKISPEIAMFYPEDEGKYLNSRILDIVYDVSDNKSDPSRIKTKLFFDGKEMENKSVDLSFQNLGQHKVKITAEDEAGNVSENEAVFESFADIDSVISNVIYYFNSGFIKNENDKKILLSQLGVLGLNFRLRDNIKDNEKISAKAKSSLLRSIEKIINLEIKIITAQLKNKNGFKSIDQKIKSLLVESVKSLNISG